jgi:hypothetical protein
MLGCSPQELGWREVETILLDHLCEAEAYAFTIADNRVAETAAWNNTLLTEQLKQISRATPDIAIETSGFELTEIGLLTAKGARGVRKPSRRPTPRRAPPLRPARRDVLGPRSPDAPQPRHHRHAHPERVGSVEHQSTYSGGRGPVDKRAVNRAIILGWQSRSRSATRSRRTRGWQSRRRTELCAGVQLPRGLLYPLDYEFDFITAGGMLIRWN